MVDWVEAWNGRVAHQAVNDQAAAVAKRAGVPAIGVSDAHTLVEIGSAYTTMTGDPSTPAGLLAALRGPLGIERGHVTSA
ncbi:MAG: PHP-associated domain-containing protein, partial [Candidatus Limnocylindrales bacterium]